MKQILFVCLGNICRSPMAEAVFRDLVYQEGLQDQIKVDSAGTGPWHVGKVPHEGTREILTKYNISYEGMKARQVKDNDPKLFHYIIAMDDQNMRDMQDFYGKDHGSEVFKLMDFVEDSSETNVPDPYYTGDFEYTYELVKEGTKNLLSYIKKNNEFN